MRKYVYYEPMGGLNDMLCCINYAINYCIKNNRILIINGMKTEYRVNLSDYFSLNINNVILDVNKIINIFANNNFSVYPNEFNGKLMDIVTGKIKFEYHTPYSYIYWPDNVILKWPYKKIYEDVLVTANCGSGNSFVLFNQLKLKPIIKDECYKRYNLLDKPYLCLQIRNTDYKTNYEDFYDTNKEIISSYKEIYVATDDKKILDFFINKGINIKNFTTFPESEYYNLHNNQSINPNTKFLDLFSDIYIASMSDNLLLAKSQGNFVNLLKSCFNNKTLIKEQFSVL